MNYITMTFDLKNSRMISEREQLQYQLIDAIQQCNDTFQEMIASPFLIILGDEWQGLLKENADYSLIINFFREHLPAHVEFYTGIGIGDVYIHNFRLTVNQLDGPSFYLAREAIDYAKKNNHNLVILKD